MFNFGTALRSSALFSSVREEVEILIVTDGLTSLVAMHILLL